MRGSLQQALKADHLKKLTNVSTLSVTLPRGEVDEISSNSAKVKRDSSYSFDLIIK